MTRYYMTESGLIISSHKLGASAGDAVNISVDGERLMLEQERPPLRDRQLEIQKIVSSEGFDTRWPSISPYFAECALIGHRWILGTPRAHGKFDAECEFCGFII